MRQSIVLAAGIAAASAALGAAQAQRDRVTQRQISARGKGLLIASGELIGTPGPVTLVGATLTCGAADATATRFGTITGFALDAAGDFTIRGPLRTDGINTAVLPDTCTNPVLLIRSVNASTGALGGWFAAGIPGSSDD